MTEVKEGEESGGNGNGILCVVKETVGIEPSCNLSKEEKNQKVVLCDESTGEVSIVTPCRLGHVNLSLSPQDSSSSSSSSNIQWIETSCHGTARDVKFSPDLNFVSIVENRNDVAILPTTTTTTTKTTKTNNNQPQQSSPTSSSTQNKAATKVLWNLHEKNDLNSNRRKSTQSSSSTVNNTMTLGCFWPFPLCCVVITTDSIEVYTVDSSKTKPPKKTKTISMVVHWFRYVRETQTLLICISSATVQLFSFQTPGIIAKLQKVDIAEPTVLDVVPPWHIGIVQIYGFHYIAQIVWTHPPEQSRLPPDIVLWPFTNKDSSNQQQATQLLLNPIRIPTPFNSTVQGDVRFQVVNNLLVVHDFISKTSIFYDLHLLDFPAVPFPVTTKAAATPSLSTSIPALHPNLYSSEGIFIDKCWAIDTRDASLWRLSLNMEKICHDLDNKVTLVRFLQRRKGGKHVILHVIREMIKDKPLQYISAVFDRLNVVLSSNILLLEQQQQQLQLQQSGSPSQQQTTTTTAKVEEEFTSDGFIIIRQNDMYENVFSPLEEDSKAVTATRFLSTLIEYIRSLNFFKMSVEPYLHGRLIHTLVTNNRFFQLQQLLQYHVIGDSTHVACQLLSLESTYPPACQMALDMLKRLDENERIIEVLLVKNEVIAALRFLQATHPRNLSSVDVSRFLDVASVNPDASIFFTAYKFFEQHNSLPQGCRLPADQFLTPIPPPLSPQTTYQQQS